MLSTSSSSAIIVFLEELDMNSSGLIIYSWTPQTLIDDMKFITFAKPEKCYGIHLSFIFIERRITNSQLLSSQPQNWEEN